MKFLRAFIINYLVKHLLKAVSEEDILQIVNDGYLYKKRKLTPEEVVTLREEARIMQDSFLWKLMTKEVEYLAFISMTSKAKTNDDIIWGKAIFYAIDIMRKFLGELSKKENR